MALWAFALLLGSVLLTTAATVTIGWMATEPTTRHLWYLAATVLGGALAGYFGQFVWNAVVQRAEGRLRADLLTAALEQPVKVLTEQPSGEILDRVDDDTDALGYTIRWVMWQVARVLLATPLLVVVAGITWWPAWIVFPALLTVLVLITRPLLGEIVRRKVAEEEAWSAHAAVFEEAVSARDDLRTSLGQPFAVRRLAELSAAIHQRVKDLLGVEIRLMARTRVLLLGLLAGVTIVGAAITSGGGLDIAQLITLSLVTANVVAIAQDLTDHLPGIQEGIGALTRIRALLDAPADPIGGEAVPTGAIDIEVHHLDFTFDDGQGEFALRDVTLAVPAGQVIALVGRSGSGKTTLASMLTRAVEPPNGSIRLGGIDVRDLDLHALRNAVGIVTQRTELLAGTLRQNVTLFAEVAPGTVERAIAELGLTEWVAGLPDGLETLLGAGGTNLSAGEEQLVAFTRLLVRDVQVVVLDEATARMDPLTEARVVAAAQRLLNGRTGVLVAHRLSTIERADLVAVLDHGRVSQFGPRTELATQVGPYRTLLDAAAVTGSLDDEADEPEVEADETLATPESAEVGTKRRQGEIIERRAPHQGAGLLRAVARALGANPLWGLLGTTAFTISMVLAPAGPLVGFFWARTIVNIEAGTPVFWLLLGMSAALAGSVVTVLYGVWGGSQWWNQNNLRVRMAVLRGQTEQRRLPATPPGEVVARAMDSERLLGYAYSCIDLLSGFVVVGITTLLGGSWLVGAVLLVILVASAAASVLGRPIAGRSAKAAADARANFGRVLVSAVTAARTVKLSARTEQVHAHLMTVDQRRIKASVFEHRVRALLGGATNILCSLGAVLAWFLLYQGTWNLTTTLLVSTTLGGFGYFGYVAGAVITEAPGARAWQRAAQELTDGADLFALPNGVSLVTGAAPAPTATPCDHLEQLELRNLTVAFDDDGTIGVSNVTLTVRRGELVLLAGQVGSGKSALLATLAGLMSYTGEVRWNGTPVADPEAFLRPGQVAYVAQVPQVLSGTFAENIALDHVDRDLSRPIRDARLEADVAEAGGLETRVGHRGAKLSGGQVQRLALARALAADAELLVADDVSSALDAITEVELWETLRARGTTVIGSTSKTAALSRADRVVVLAEGEIAAIGPWAELSGQWGHLAG